MDTKRLLLVFFVFIFAVNSVTAYEFDNTYNYNETTKTATIHNCDFWLLGCLNQGEVLAEATLIWGDTKVGVGIDTHVGTFLYTPMSNTTTDIQDLDLVNLKNGQIMTRGKQYKVKVYFNESVDDYETTCISETWDYTLYPSNPTCTKTEIGSHIEERYEWTPLSNPHIELQEDITYEIGVFVDTEEGDLGDWLPTFAGVQIEEWATWDSGLTNGLISYYDFESVAGNTAEDIYADNDLYTNASITGSGKINNAYDFGTTEVWAKDTAFPFSSTGSVSYWVQFTDTSNGKSHMLDPQNIGGIHCQVFSGDWYCAVNDGSFLIGTAGPTAGSTWYHVVFTWDGTNEKLYIDGSNVATLSEGTSTSESPLIVGMAIGGGSNLNGVMDEMGIWDRALTQSEVTQLNNGGAGLTPVFDSDNPPVITNPLPTNNTIYTATTTVDFNWTASDDINLLSTAIYIDGVLESNRTSSINGTLQTYQKSLSSGIHNWSVIAFDNSSQNATAGPYFVNISIVPPTIELSAPADMSYTNNENVTFYAYVYDNTGVANVSLYINGSLVETNTDGTNATNYSFTQTLTGGPHNWYIKAIDIDGFESDSATRTINVDLDPVQINATVLTPIVYNYGDIVQVNVTAVDLFLQECWYEYNSITTFFNCTTEIPQIVNVTSVAGQTQINFSANHSVGDVASEIVNFTYDTVVPSVNVTVPIDYSEYGYENLEFNVSFTVNDTNLDSCWAEYPIGNAISGFSCSNTTFTIDVANYSDSIIIYANDTLGNQNNSTRPINFYVYNINSTADATVIIGQTAEFTTQNYWDSSEFGSINAYVNWNGVRKGLATKVGVGDYVNFTSEFLIAGLTEDTNVTVYWEFFIDGEYHNSTSFIQETQTLEIDDCLNYSYTVVNLTLKDEELNQILNATNESTLIEVDLFINSNGDEILQYSNVFNLINPASVCSEIDLTGRGFNYDLDVGFSSTDRVQEFYFVDNRLVESQNIPANISLMDLKSVDSTSFLFNYYGSDGLPVENSLVHTYRKYIGDGLFRKVEVSRSDQNGDTIVHLVEEDVIYYFEITQNDVSIFNSSEYTALCQATPCTVVINAVGTSSQFPTDWDLIDDGAYSISSSPSTRMVTLDYATDGLSTFDLTVYKYANDGTYTEVNSTTSTDTSGSLSIYVPQTAGNYSFFASVDKDSEFVDSEWVDMATDPRDIFGVTMALFLGALIILTLGLFAISEGTGTLVYVLLGVFLSGALGLVTLELASGINILAYLIVAGGIYLWKLTRGRN